MNSIYLVLAGALVFILAYRFYGAWIAAKILELDGSRPTPAVTHNDGHDYVPTNKWIVFGHHFAAIAGAGPLIGPVLAAQFGYLPGTLWILIGAVVAGAVHDMIILFASVRHDGLSIAEIAKKEIGSFSGICTSIGVLFILVISMAGLGIAVVNALYGSPWGTFTVGITIPIAILIGLYMKYLRPGKVGEATVIGVVLVLAGVIGGALVQHSALAPYLTFSKEQLTIMMAVYGFVAAALPVWLLLAPRDYLSTYMKIGTILVLALGIIIVRPEIRMPATTIFTAGGGPIIPGAVFPFLFITIACGALSGFHSLISSGTTPKMLPNEREVLPVGYGAMLVEGFVGLMAVIAATALHPGDYFAINSAPAVFQKLVAAHPELAAVDLQHLSNMVGENIAGRPGGAVSLAVGMAFIFSSIPVLDQLMSYWYHFAIMFEALFILTTIDAGTRVGRYLLMELLGRGIPKFKDTNWWPGVIITSGAISVAWGYLLYGGNISTIWPMFGVANQLLGAMAFAIGTTVLFRMGKGKYTPITIIPMVFVSIVTITADWLNIFQNYIPKGQWLLVTLSVIMLVLVLAVIIDSVRKWITMNSSKSNNVNAGTHA